MMPNDPDATRHILVTVALNRGSGVALIAPERNLAISRKENRSSEMTSYGVASAALSGKHK